MKVSNVSKTKKGRILHLPFEFKLFKSKFGVKGPGGERERGGGERERESE